MPPKSVGKSSPWLNQSRINYHTSRVFKDIKFLLAIQKFQTSVHGSVDIFRASIRYPVFESSFNAENNLVCILWVLRKVPLQKCQTIELWSTVKFSSIPLDESSVSGLCGLGKGMQSEV